MHVHKVGDSLSYTGRGSNPDDAVEFRGYHSHAETGEKMARVIFRPKSGAPYEMSVHPKDLQPKAEQHSENEYRGFKIESYEGLQVGHRNKNSKSNLQQLGLNTKRNIKGFLASHPEHYPNGKHHNTLKAAKKWIDEFHGDGQNSEQFAESATHSVFEDMTHEGRVKKLAKQFGGLGHPEHPNRVAVPLKHVDAFHAAATKAGMFLKHKSPTGAYHYRSTGSIGASGNQFAEAIANESVTYSHGYRKDS